MGSEFDDKRNSTVQFEDESSKISSSEIVDTTNGIKNHEKLVDDYSDGNFNGRLDDHLDSGPTYEAAKDGPFPGDGDVNPIIKAVRIAGGTGDPISPSNLTSEYDLNRILIDTTAPFESVKEAVSKFGGIVDWKSHKVQTIERRKLIKQELKKVQQEIPVYKEQSEVAEQSKIQTLKDLENAKRLMEDLKLNLERAQMEERQAKQDSELAQLRAEEMEQGITHEASVAAKTQIEVAKARHETAISDLKTVKKELESLRKEYSSLLKEKIAAEKKAEEAVSASKEIEKTVEELTIELITTKESAESAHALHLEAEEHRNEAVDAKERDRLSLDKDLKQAEEDLARLIAQIESAKDLKLKLNTASSVLADLKAELATYMESKINQENNGSDKELEEVKLNIKKATDELNGLKAAATSLKAELEKEKLELNNLRQRESMASVEVASLEVELERIKSGIDVVRMREKETKERMATLPKELKRISREADEAKSSVELVREELRRAEEEAERAKAKANSMESRLRAAQKEIEAARASERLAVAAVKALQECESTKTVNNGDDDTRDGITLPLEKYYELSKRARDAEEEANMKVAAVMSQIEVAKDYESRSLAQLEDANREVEQRQKALGIAMKKAEKAQEGKLGVEQELRTRRGGNENVRKTGGSGHGIREVDLLSEPSFKIERVVDSASPPVHYGQGLGLKDLEQITNPTGSGRLGTMSKSYSEESVSSPRATFGQSNTVKKKRRSLFPRFFMFLARRKPSSKTS
ncbi:hypothetical protein RND81_09G022500 [Saponaria officinalis]|uniref:WEB family protein n=1 Tax=Saponaria officinalis TaxID=3572 RepID=A0AAW1IHT0_SAPOF